MNQWLVRLVMYLTLVEGFLLAVAMYPVLFERERRHG